ncbi:MULTISPECIES: tripartite tricarboxylate transporter substrate binding protein [Achromobacter]|uniref:Tripartite tricarboxylate transporter substrate binding protein n=1 Tax=Alcaligenes xylosoxydans xylosoxydans TaxID=85698 RepID=A0A424WK70_ALCXX|nr:MULTISPECIES: tripartite tricarboxylate transporter substrate binding protein [Achromobacter]MBC9903017.1 tripartite tricarboxylate transporter substrate binding protein [Achromobacter xylosoxidans]MBD0867607.1 tripartite tricarboxylate transporter substrate binding protein [Achromobacter xylosoxidans]MDH1299149.1 tripartite tricarboxylate transporter substrate binding protein [Achromobacter sp. GD03932]QNP86908.1 tripartite tricarboxylate transporter substrate binding protein [Achromobacter
MKFIVKLASGLAACMLAAGAHAEWPDRPIRMVIGFAPGGASDIAFKMVQDELSKKLGQPVVPIYKPGANGNIANQAVATAEPDGYTALWANVGPLAINTYLYKGVQVDPGKAFVPVTQLTDSPLVVVVPKSSPFQTMQDLVQAAKKPDAGLSYGSAGHGSSMHVAGAALSLALNAPMTHVPYKGSAPALQDLIAGRLSFMVDSRSTTAPFIKEGTLRALAVSGDQRVADMPDVPTVAESGVPGFKVTTWQAVVMPAGTPQPIVDKFSGALRETLQMPEVQERFARIYTPLVGSTPEAFAAFWAKERAGAKTLVEQARLQVD